MKSFTKLWRMLNNYLNHPLCRRDRFGTLFRMIRWQTGSRVLGMSVSVPFVDDTRLMMSTGMHGATGNIYVGLMEYEDMAFVLHLLNKGDVFLDVGANVGVFSILAASRGAMVLAMEPVPETYDQLLDNININRFHALIKPMNIGVGSQSGELQFTTQTGPTNHVLTEGEHASDAVTVVVKKLDEIVQHENVTMIKIDVEGFEREVVNGGAILFAQDSLQAILIELNGLSTRYGFNDAEIHAQIIGFGFSPVDYHPSERKLHSLELHHDSGNTLYVRPSAKMDQRLRDARPIVWNKFNL